MNQKELNGMVGKVLTIRGATHLCLAAGRDAILLLQLAMRDEPIFKKGDPVQYIVARGPYLAEEGLVWRAGSYYPLLGYEETNGMPASWQALESAMRSPVWRTA